MRPAMTNEELLKLVADAEKRIQRVLRDLQEEVGGRVNEVNVDTRNYANCLVEIFLDLRKR